MGLAGAGDRDVNRDMPTLRINFFTPLPPALTDVANNAVTVATALSRIADLTLWTPREAPAPAIEGIAVRRFDAVSPPWAEINTADLNIYNLGNNAPFHRAIFDIARQAPGVVVLHDVNLQAFFAPYSDREGADRSFYIDAMRRSHGLPGINAALALIDGRLGAETMVDEFPMTLAAMAGALGVIVHNKIEADALRAQTSVPVFHLPLAYAARPTLCRAGRTQDGPSRLVVFGFLGANRRLESTLTALAALPPDDYRLDIYGPVAEPERISGVIARLGLGARVEMHGFVAFETLTAALESADLAINLRWPSVGEVSGSQLRIWDAGLPALVTRTGWYTSLSPDTVFFVEPDREIETITEHLRALRRDPIPFRLAGLRGREVLLAEHDPASYARGVLDVAQLSPGLHARAQAHGLARTASAALLGLGRRDGLAAGVPGVAAAILDLMRI